MDHDKYKKYCRFNGGLYQWIMQKIYMREIKEKAEKILEVHPEYKEYATILEGNIDTTDSKFNYYYEIVRRDDTDKILEEHPEWNYDFKMYIRKHYSESQIKDEKYRFYNSVAGACIEIINNYKKLIEGEYTPDWREIEKQKREKEKQEMLEKQKNNPRAHFVVPVVECPYCHSKRTIKIETMSKVISIAAVGAASNKLGKQWKCLDCKSYF